jgi:hypothetical protein
MWNMSRDAVLASDPSILRDTEILKMGRIDGE